MVLTLSLVPSMLPLQKEPVYYDRQVVIRAGKDRWVFTIFGGMVPVDGGGYEHGPSKVSVSKNGRYFYDLDDQSWYPAYYEHQLSRPHVVTRYPVIGIHGYSAAGHGQKNLYYRIVKGRLQRMGSPPAPNSNGPYTWRGRADYWVFDDFEWYRHFEPTWVKRFHLYRIRPNGRLTHVRSWPAKTDRRMSFKR